MRQNRIEVLKARLNEPSAKMRVELETCGFTVELLDILAASDVKKFRNLGIAARRGLAASKDQQRFLVLCATNNVSLVELEKIWTEHEKSKSKIALASKLTAIVNGIARDASPELRICNDCKGLGIIESDENYPLCTACNGDGRIYIRGSIESQKLALEVIGLTGKQAPLVGQIGDIFNLEALVGGAAGLLRNERTIEGEVL